MELMSVVTDDDMSISDFMCTLDCLYALGKIELIEGRLHYVSQH